MPHDADTRLGGPYQGFPETRVSLIDAAALGGAGLSRDALDAVITAYWKPAYKHIRSKWRRSNEEAKDLTQGFFAALSGRDTLASFDPARGSFRNYLRSCLDRYVLQQHEFENRQKRGGAAETLDFDEAERELAASPEASPEQVFFREWRRQMFALALDDLRRHALGSGRELQFRIFEQYDLADGDRPRYADLARQHGVAETTVVNHLAWARRELRRLLVDRLAGVTASPAELRGETRALLE
jgi:RNA polymerase sigma-70 factor (ECF subfamily)